MRATTCKSQNTHRELLSWKWQNETWNMSSEKWDIRVEKGDVSHETWRMTNDKCKQSARSRPRPRPTTRSIYWRARLYIGASRLYLGASRDKRAKIYIDVPRQNIDAINLWATNAINEINAINAFPLYIYISGYSHILSSYWKSFAKTGVSWSAATQS